MAIDFKQEDNKLILVYEPEYRDIKFVHEALVQKGRYFLKRIFLLQRNELICETDYDMEFEFGVRDGDYFKIDGSRLGVDEHNLFIHHEIEITDKMFIAVRNISIFKRLFSMMCSDIYIGGKHEDCLSLHEFKQLVRAYPNNTELDKYVYSRLHKITEDFLNIKKDYMREFEDLLRKRELAKHNDLTATNKLLNVVSKYEVEKYRALLNKMQGMLESEVAHSEESWQQEVLDIILLMYPKYIAVLPKVRLSLENKRREFDFLLVDINGNVDIIEIKKSYGVQTMSKNKYRENHIPLRDLTGTIMQLEKYISFLSHSSGEAETKLNRQYKAHIPENFEMKITYPHGIIIMGRDNELTSHQKADFEVIKRQHKNIIDIITYDELLKRLELLIQRFESNVADAEGVKT